MSARVREATEREVSAIWPAASADRLFPDEPAYRAFAEQNPWALRVTERGSAALLERWKAHLDVLAMRGVWALEAEIPALVSDALDQACERGFGRVLSPLVPLPMLEPYRAGGMRVAQRIVAVQGHPELVSAAEAPVGVTIREGTRADIGAVAHLDETAFDEFWRWERVDLERFLAEERLAVAQAKGGAVIGYTLATVSRGAATLTRLAVAPHARNAGVGRALVSEAARWAMWSGAVTFALCTQEDNAASRALYAAMGLAEIPERYAFGIAEVAREAGS